MNRPIRTLYLTHKSESSFNEEQLGDVNGDGIRNILDVVIIVNNILSGTTELIENTGDLNGDGAVNVLDVVTLVNIILE